MALLSVIRRLVITRRTVIDPGDFPSGGVFPEKHTSQIFAAEGSSPRFKTPGPRASWILIGTGVGMLRRR